MNIKEAKEIVRKKLMAEPKDGLVSEIVDVYMSREEIFDLASNP